jgi:hypothetical protein
MQGVMHSRGGLSLRDLSLFDVFDLLIRVGAIFVSVTQGIPFLLIATVFGSVGGFVLASVLAFIAGAIFLTLVCFLSFKPNALNGKVSIPTSILMVFVRLPIYAVFCVGIWYLMAID